MQGKWYGHPTYDYINHKWLLTFEVKRLPPEYEETKDSELSIEIKKYRKRRSLDANAYFYVLVNKIADALNISDQEVHDKILRDNLCFIYKNGLLDWMVCDDEPNDYGLLRRNNDYYLDSGETIWMANEDGHYYYTDGKPKEGRIFWHIKGSHQMDTKEMARLIDSTIQEAQQLDIETATPDELERMKQQWDLKVC